jgi:opine dehydrogenase
MEKIAVLGTGNGGFAVAGSLSLCGYEVCLFNRSPSRLEPILKHGGINVAGIGENGLAQLANTTTAIEQAIFGAEIIVQVIPTTLLDCYREPLSSIFDPEAVVCLEPG